jgi:hypothetical protein
MDTAGNFPSKAANKSRANVVGRTIAQPKESFADVGLVALLFGLVSCTTPFDMSDERITAAGPDWGVVIGSVLVRPEEIASDKNATGRDVFNSSYEFDIVPIQPGDPNGEGPYVKQYRLDAKGGAERIFIARLRSGQYLIRRFHEEKLTGLGGELDLVFASMAGEVRYIGRVVVEIPRRISRGKDYRFTVENAREPTLAQVSTKHPDLAKNAVNIPMQVRVEGR